jgi:elongation factor Ts
MVNLTSAMIKELRERTGVGMAKCKEALVEAEGNIDQAIEYLRKKGMASAVKKESRETKEGAICCAESPTHLALVEVAAETDFVVKNDKFQIFLNEVTEHAAKTNPANLDELMKDTYSKDKNLTLDEYRNITIQALGENIQVKRVEIIERKDVASYGVYSHMGGQILCLVELAGASSLEKVAKDVAMHIAAEDPDYLSNEDVPEDIIKKEEDIARSQVKGKPENVIDKIVAGKVRSYCDQNCLLSQKFVKDPSLSVKAYIDACSKEVGKSLSITRFWRWSIS